MCEKLRNGIKICLVGDRFLIKKRKNTHITHYDQYNNNNNNNDNNNNNNNDDDDDDNKDIAHSAKASMRFKTNMIKA